MGQTRIEWAEKSWNPIVGCTRVSEGCRHCYAERQAARLAGMARADQARGRGPGAKADYATVVDAQGHWFGRTRLIERTLGYPLGLHAPARVFVCSMSDLFHGTVPFAVIDRVFAVMASAGRHTFLVLTKRPERMAEYYARVAAGAPEAAADYERRLRAHFERYKMEFREGYSLPGPPTPELRYIYDSAVRQEARPLAPDGTTLAYGFSGGEYHWRAWPLTNVWLGVTVENDTALRRIPLLLRVPAAIHWVSCEPLLGPVALRPWLRGGAGLCGCGGQCDPFDPCPMACNAAAVDWVVCGGESGPGARRMHPDWARSLRDQCALVGVPFFFKQWGRYDQDGQLVRRKPEVSLLDGRAHQEYPATRIQGPEVDGGG